MQTVERPPVRIHDLAARRGRRARPQPGPTSQRRPAGRRTVALALMVLALSLAAFYREILFDGRTIATGAGTAGVMGLAGAWERPEPSRLDPYRTDRGASAWQREPQLRAVARALGEGRLPLWNAGQGFGAPLAANAQSGGFDPLRLPLALGPQPLAEDLFHLGRLLIGMALIYAFCARFGLLPPARIAVALAYAYSGHLVLLNNNHWLTIYLLLPGVLLGTELLLTGRELGGLVLTSATVALGGLAGMPEPTLLTWLFAALYGAYRWLALVRAAGWSRRLLRPAGLLGLAWLLGVGLALPLVLPLAEFVAHAFHAHAPDQVLGLAAAPIPVLARLALPTIHGLPLIPLVDGLAEDPTIRDYSGAVVLTLACLAIAAPPRGRARSLWWFALGAAAVLGGKIFGLPLVNELGRLPGLNVSHLQYYGSPLLSFSLALLAGLAVHGLMQAPPTRRSLVLAGALLVGYFGLAIGSNWSLLTRPDAAVARAAVGIGLSWVALVGLWLRLARRAPGWLRGGGCCALIFAELLVLAPRGVYQVRHDPASRPPFVAQIQQERAASGPFRIFATDGLLFPNWASAFGLDDIRALDALYPERSYLFTRELLDPGALDRFTGLSGRPIPGANRWLDLVNVRFIATPVGQELGPSASLRLVYRGEVDLYENLAARPRAFLAERVRRAEDREVALAVLRRPDFDPGREVVVEGLAEPVELDDLPVLGGVTVTHYADDQVELQVSADRRRLLVLTDAVFPGWLAEVDGQPAPILPADLAFRGVVVEPGEHRVRFRYAPVSVGLGLAAGGFAALALAVSAVLLALRPAGTGWTITRLRPGR